MKYLLVIAVVLTVIWFLRSPRRMDGVPRGRAPGPAAPQAMVACAVCGMHVPSTESLPGPDGSRYCCAEHRDRRRD